MISKVRRGEKIMPRSKILLFCESLLKKCVLGAILAIAGKHIVKLQNVICLF